MTSRLSSDLGWIEIELSLDFLHVLGVLHCLHVATYFRSQRLVMWPHTCEYLGVDECARTFPNCAHFETTQSWNYRVDVAFLVVVGDKLTVLVVIRPLLWNLVDEDDCVGNLFLDDTRNVPREFFILCLIETSVPLVFVAALHLLDDEDRPVYVNFFGCHGI